MLITANDHFGSSNGTQNWYPHPPSMILYSDGIRDMVQSCRSLWLLDAIVSNQSKREMNKESFQEWELFRIGDSSFDVIGSDIKGNIITSQQIEYSDFKYDHCAIWLIKDRMILPREY